MQMSQEVLAAIVGALLGSVITAVISIVLHNRSLAHERKLRDEQIVHEHKLQNEQRTWDFLGRLIPVLSALFSKATPEGIRDAAEVDDLVHRALMSGREAGFWDILPGSANLAPITDTARDYGEKLKHYRNGQITREQLERERRAGIQRITEFVNVLKPTAKGVEVV
jgi:hypothetical protein